MATIHKTYVFQAHSGENAIYTIAAMAPCPYIYAELAKRSQSDHKLNREKIRQNGLIFIVLKWMT